MKSIEPQGDLDYPGAMIVIKEEKIDAHSVIQSFGAVGNRLSGVFTSDPNASKEDSSILHDDLIRLETIESNDHHPRDIKARKIAKKYYIDANNQRYRTNNTLVNVNTNTSQVPLTNQTSRTALSPA